MTKNNLTTWKQRTKQSQQGLSQKGLSQKGLSQKGLSQRGIMIILLFILAGFAGGLWLFYENGLPPKIEAELKYTNNYLKGTNWQIPADENFTLRFKANEPTLYTVNYNDEEQTSPKLARVFEVSFQAVRGDQVLELLVQDRAKNTKTYQYKIFGVPLLQPLIRAPHKIKPGYPISVQMMWPPQSYGVTLATINIALDDQSLDVIATLKDVVALAAIPLEDNMGSHILSIDLTDAFGRTVEIVRTLEIETDSQETQVLNLSAEHLNLRTPENLAAEEKLIEESYKTSTNTLPLWTEPFIFPLNGDFNITSPFGTPRIYGEFGDFAHHTGSDFAAPTGTSVAATNDGIAVIVGYYPIRGGFIMLDHGAGVFSLYFHLETFYISVGDKIKRGNFIAEVGNTGLSSGSHLHWEMRVQNMPTEPFAWVDKLFP